jgi:hypothetical protein
MAEREDGVRRFVLYYKGSGMPNAEDISRIAELRGVRLIDHELPRLALVEGPEKSLRELIRDLPDWTIGPERLIKLGHEWRLATEDGR